MELDPQRRLFALLDARQAPYRVLRHPPVRTAAEAAAARGTPLEIGAKALVLKTDGRFRLFALPAGRELSARAVRRGLGVSRTRFASPYELQALTGLAPGSVPPFGEPVLPLELLGDPLLLAADEIAFTAAAPDCSVVMPASEWARAARPRLLACSRAAG